MNESAAHTDLEELCLSIRAFNCLKRSDINTTGQILELGTVGGRGTRETKDGGVTRIKKGNRNMGNVRGQLENQTNIFDFLEEDFKNNKTTPAASGTRLDVVRLEYVQAESVSWQELFSGFNHLSAITYSSGIGFVYRLLDMFDTAEIVFGCENVLSLTLQEIMAYQNNLIERMRNKMGDKKEALLARIDNGEIRLFVARQQLSHEKIYLLSSGDGRKRVIMGSANMSFQAFSGLQRENICYIDGDAAYDWYMDIFNSLKDSSTDSISHKALDIADLQENADALPIAESVKTKKAIVIETVQDNKEDIAFVLDIKRLAKKISPMMPKADKGGKTVITPDSFVKLRKHFVDEARREKDLRSEFPQLRVNIDERSVVLNGEAINLAPDADAIKNDVALFIKYMTDLEQFHGDFRSMQMRYFEFANWFFCSPFMAPMRDMAARYDKQRLLYPVFGIMFGESNAGKSSFLATLLLMMIGQKPTLSGSDFTKSRIDQLKRTVDGAPIIIEDLTRDRFTDHAIEAIKYDDFGVADGLTCYPAVAINGNRDLDTVRKEIVKRAVICRAEANLSPIEALRSNTVSFVQKNIGTALYREYLRRMLDLVPDLLEQFKDDDGHSPDILAASSEVLCALMTQYADTELPGYVRPLTVENYFGASVIGKNAWKTIRNAWRTSPKSFEVNRKSNELRYHTGSISEPNKLLNELPETMEAHRAREWVIMNLDEAKRFFELDFRKSRLPWKR